MKKQFIRMIGISLVAALWLLLAFSAWFSPSRDVSDAERRNLAQFPTLSAQTLLNGSFMTKFEEYTLDQFPLRDSFRQVKSLFHYNVLGQKDNNNIYLADGYAAKLEYPLNEASVNQAVNRFNWIYDNYLVGSDCRAFFTVAPDKGYYLAETNGYPAMDYQKLFSVLKNKLPWAEHVDITDCLSIEDYYRTDTHWRQEALLDAAKKLGNAMNVSIPDFTKTQIEKPFYGVYYGQAALPMDSEPMYILNNDTLAGCTVYNHETKGTSSVYDMTKLDSRDLYDIYLSGAASLLTITNPSASTDRELIVFRDSFGSSMVPLLVQDYKTVTLVDIRYVSSAYLEQVLDFDDQDVLFLYSTLILNNSTSLK